MNFLLLTYDSSLYDVFCAADTPVLDSYSHAVAAQAPVSFTYASHQAMFVGILPHAVDKTVPVTTGFSKQLVELAAIGQRNLARDSLKSLWNLIRGFHAEGYQTVGAGSHELVTAGIADLEFERTLIEERYWNEG